MERWHLPSIAAIGKRDARVLFSRPGCRAVVIDLKQGEEMGDHSVHENAIVHVVSGTVSVSADGDEADCGPGSLVVFPADERHSVRAREAARLLLVLAPWPGKGHYQAGEEEHLAANAHVPPLAD